VFANQLTHRFPRQLHIEVDTLDLNYGIHLLFLLLLDLGRLLLWHRRLLKMILLRSMIMATCAAAKGRLSAGITSY